MEHLVVGQFAVVASKQVAHLQQVALHRRVYLTPPWISCYFVTLCMAQLYFLLDLLLFYHPEGLLI